MAHTLRDQLAPVAFKNREIRSWVRPVSQVHVRLKALPDSNRFQIAVDEVLRWMDKRAGKRLPEAAWNRQSFQMEDVGAQRVAAVSLDEYWTARLDDADKEIPQRTWVTEIAVGLAEDGDVLFGCRLICATRGTEKLMPRSIPSFVRAVFATGPVEMDGLKVRADQPRFLQTETDVEELIRLLELPMRRAPVIAFALPEGSSNVQDAVLPVGEFAKSVAGAAHVVVLSSAASFALTDQAGKEFSVFRQAVRVYHRGFSRWADQASRHPLTLPARVNSWQMQGIEEQGARAYARWLADLVLSLSVQRADREVELPSFNAVRQIAAQRERQRLTAEGGSQAELLQLYEDDNKRLEGELQEERDRFVGQVTALEDERDQAIEQRDEMRRQAFDLRERIRGLHDQLNRAADPVPKAPTPETLHGFEVWCREHLAGAVDVHNRANRGVQKSKYEHPKLIYQALLLMRDHYVPMRRTGLAEHRAAFEKVCKALQLEDSFVGEATKTHSKQYTVKYGGKPRMLDRHLKRGASHDERRNFRMYYFWDDETETVVVGWLPSHLDNSMT